MPANFTRDADGIDRCSKYLTVRLSRAENDYCLRLIDQPARYPDYGGGKKVDALLVQLLVTALRAGMRREAEGEYLQS
jgi:hypothetical protein